MPAARPPFPSTPQAATLGFAHISSFFEVIRLANTTGLPTYLPIIFPLILRLLAAAPSTLGDDHRLPDYLSISGPEFVT
jgi:hypothetical protein